MKQAGYEGQLKNMTALIQQVNNFMQVKFELPDDAIR
jgi:hypothetical protein